MTRRLQSATVEDVIQLVKAPFGITSDDKMDSKVKCSHCAFTTTDKNPSNLQKHLKRHPTALADVETKTGTKRAKAQNLSSASATTSKSTETLSGTSVSVSSQPKISPFIGTSKPYDQDSIRYRKLRQAVGVLFASHSLPHLLVESDEFRRLISLLDSRFVLPNRRALATDIKALRCLIKENILAELGRVDKLTVILDIWSRKGLSESYLGIIVKYVKPESTEIAIVLLALRKMHGSHTAQNVYETLQHELSSWKVGDEKILYYVTDNGSNMVKALKECITEYAPLTQKSEIDEGDEEYIQLFEESDPNLETSFIEEEIDAEVQQFEEVESEYNGIFACSKRLPCVAHQLSCAVRKCVDKSKILQPIIKSAFNLVKKISQSQLSKELFLKYNSRSLLSPSQTRWIYSYYVIDRLIESKEAVENVITDMDLLDVALEPLKWKQLGYVRDILRPFATAVKDLEGDTYATLSQVIPALVDMIENLRERAKTSVGFGIIASDLKDELDRRFSFILNPTSPSFQPAYLVATFLDHRFVAGLTQEQQTLSIDFILRFLGGNEDLSLQAVDSGSCTVTTTAPGKYSGFWKRAQLQRSVTPPTNDDRMRSWKAKLQSYLEESLEKNTVADDSKGNSPLSYWFAKRDAFKEIAHFAMNLLAVSASSAGIERVFSIASIVQGGRRFHLSADTTEDELMVKLNAKFLSL